jgi:hypothetical protein
MKKPIMVIAEVLLTTMPGPGSRLACPITQLPLLGIQPQAWECAPHV